MSIEFQVPPGEMLERVYPLGGHGGVPFPDIPVSEIGFATGDYVDRIYLNDQWYGGVNKGAETSRLKFASNEFIIRVEGRCGSWMNAIKITTNLGRWIGGGGGGGVPFLFDGIKVLSIAGRHNNLIDKLELRILIDASINPKPTLPWF